MAQPFITATLLYSRFSSIADHLAEAVDEAIEKAALDIEARAKANITSVGAVDTGATKASIYSVTPSGSSYGANTGEARSARPGVTLEDEATVGDHEAVVAVGTSYGAWIELGANGVAPRPFLIPAAEAVRGPFLDRMKEVFD